MGRQLAWEERDRLCYLFDDGDDRGVYAILKEIGEDKPSDTEPEVPKAGG